MQKPFILFVIEDFFEIVVCKIYVRRKFQYATVHKNTARLGIIIFANRSENDQYLQDGDNAQALSIKTEANEVKIYSPKQVNDEEEVQLSGP